MAKNDSNDELEVSAGFSHFVMDFSQSLTFTPGTQKEVS